MRKDKSIKKGKKISKKLKVIICLFVAIAIGGVLIMTRVQAIRDELAQGREVQTITLEKTDITRSISVSGVVESAVVRNVYSIHNTYPVKVIHVEVGDPVKAGDLLAELDMSRLENDISQTEVSLRSAILAAEEEERANNNSITNARTSLESAQITLSRQQLSTQNIEADLLEAEERMEEEFDSYIFDIAIEEARIALDRITVDLESAQKDLDNAINDFDEYAHQNAIRDAERDRDRAQSDLRTAREDYSDARSDYNSIASSPDATDAAISAAWGRVETARRARDTANRVLDDANTRVDRLKTDLQRAQNDAIDIASDILTNVENIYADAQRAYQRAMTDKIRAIDDNFDVNETLLDNAQRAFDDSQIQLESTHNSVRSAQNALSQARDRQAAGDANVEIQELTLQRLNNQLEEGKIFATVDGVITEVHAREGAAPTGIMFVIEDTQDLYVSVRVREHSLSDVVLGMESTITTDATGDNEYAGIVSYISPKAVSEAGSTAVEFEVRAELIDPDPAIKIGMNAFLDIIIERKSDVYAVPNSVIVTNERGSFVYTMEGEEKREIAVTLGIRTMVNAEISGQGLHDGLELVVDPEGLLADPNAPRFPPMWG